MEFEVLHAQLEFENLRKRKGKKRSTFQSFKLVDAFMAGWRNELDSQQGFLSSILYHLWLWWMVRSQPQKTHIGINSTTQQLWVLSMIKDNGKKQMLVVQTIRNSIMASTLMATTCVLLSTGLAAVISSTYSVKKTLEGSLVYGAHGEFIVAFKYVALLFNFLIAFLCYTISIKNMNQASYLINTIDVAVNEHHDCKFSSSSSCQLTEKYVCELFEEGFVLQIVGNRLFYIALPLLMWIFGPCLAFLCNVLTLPIMYITDIVHVQKDNVKVEMIGDQKICSEV